MYAIVAVSPSKRLGTLPRIRAPNRTACRATLASRIAPMSTEYFSSPIATLSRTALTADFVARMWGAIHRPKKPPLITGSNHAANQIP